MTDPTAPAARRRTVRVERVMGTVVSIELRGTGDHHGAVRDACAWLHEVDRRFSTYRTDSEVSRLRRGEPARSADLREVIAACEAVSLASGGAFDPHLAAGFDPSAYVKGWSVDRVGAILRGHGCHEWSVNAGGDVLVSSPDRATTPWRIGVQHPFDHDALGMVLQADDLAVATSGRYERGDHIEDRRTGMPATAVASVTVCGPELGLADAFATAAFVLGADGPAWVAGLEGYECWSVLPDGRVLATPGFPTTVHVVPVRATRTDDLLWRVA